MFFFLSPNRNTVFDYGFNNRFGIGEVGDKVLLLFSFPKRREIRRDIREKILL